MRCVSFTFIRLLPTWTPTEIFDALLAKHFADYDSIICPRKSKLRFMKVCKILKRTWYFQTDWTLCVLYCNGRSHVVNHAGSTCSYCQFLVANNVNRNWPSPTKIVPQFQQRKLLCLWKYTHQILEFRCLNKTDMNYQELAAWKFVQK